MVYAVVHNITKVPPLHIFVTQTVHDLSRSKKLINMINQLGILINYSDMLEIDTFLATKLIEQAGHNRVPVSD